MFAIQLGKEFNKVFVKDSIPAVNLLMDFLYPKAAAGDLKRRHIQYFGLNEFPDLVRSKEPLITRKPVAIIFGVFPKNHILWYDETIWESVHTEEYTNAFVSYGIMLIKDRHKLSLTIDYIKKNYNRVVADRKDRNKLIVRKVEDLGYLSQGEQQNEQILYD